MSIRLNNLGGGYLIQGDCVVSANYFVHEQTSMPDWAAAVSGVLQGLPAALALALAGGWILLNRPHRQSI